MTVNNKKTWQIIDVLNWSENYLTDKGIESARIETEWMLREILGLSRIEIYLNHQRPLNKAELAVFKKMLMERAGGKPLQYILGYTEFMGLNFKVSPAVLIPRPETEVIIERLLELFKNQKINVLDICTGSGNIGISLAKLHPHCRATGIDVSQPAIEIAKQNAENNSAKVKFIKLDILKEKPDNSKKYELIVSNPPYVAGKYFEQLPEIVKNFEPHIALNPGADEYIFYKRLAEIAKEYLVKDGFLAVEIGGDYQVETIKGIFSQQSFQDFETVIDYLGNSRGIITRLK